MVRIGGRTVHWRNTGALAAWAALPAWVILAPCAAAAMPPAADTPATSGGGLLDWLPWVMLGLSGLLMVVSVGGWLAARLRDGRAAGWWAAMLAWRDRPRSAVATDSNIARPVTTATDPSAAALDRRIERLERIVGDLERAAAQFARAAEPRQALETTAAPLNGQTRGSAQGTLSEVKPPAAEARVSGGFSPSRVPEPDADIDPLLTSVYRLSDKGLPPVEIARSLGQHTGKVELILALRRR